MALIRSLVTLVALAMTLGLFGLTGTALLTAQPVSAQVTPLEEESEEAPGLGVIVGTPDAGPDPEDAGDRGGFAQLALAIVLFAAIAFIASRIILAVRASKPAGG